MNLILIYNLVQRYGCFKLFVKEGIQIQYAWATHKSASLVFGFKHMCNLIRINLNRNGVWEKKKNNDSNFELTLTSNMK